MGSWAAPAAPQGTQGGSWGDSPFLTDLCTPPGGLQGRAKLLPLAGGAPSASECEGGHGREG